MRTVFGLDISQGAIANILQRAPKTMLAAAEGIGEEVRRAQVIADTRAAQVITDLLAGARPKVWVADRYGAQNGHGEQRQAAWHTCCATPNMPSIAATQRLLRASSPCSSGPATSASDETGSRIRRWPSIWPGTWPG